jgi:DNA-binding CsgD family transcriptional regulator
MARSKNTSQSASSSSKVRARELEIRALEYRKAGASYEQISKALGCSKAGAWKAVKRGLENLNKECNEKAREVRQIETLRLDRMWAGIYDDAANGDPRAVNTALRIMERRARLWGLDEQTEESERERKEIVFKLIGKTDAG